MQLGDWGDKRCWCLSSQEAGPPLYGSLYTSRPYVHVLSAFSGFELGTLMTLQLDLLTSDVVLETFPVCKVCFKDFL